jgi:vitamin B12 transporter
MTLLLLLAAAATADPEAIVITALPDPAADEVLSVRALDPTDLGSGATMRLDDLLRTDAGVQTFRRASSRVANPTAQGVTLRALGGNGASRAAVLLDGVPQDDPFAGWIAWSALPTSGIERVRITRGGGGVASGALSGVIALDSQSITSGLSGAARALLDDSGSAEVTAHAGLGGAGWGVGLDAQLYDSDGDILIPRRQRGAVDIPAFSRARSVALRVTGQLRPGLSAELRGSVFDERKSGGLALTPNSIDGQDLSLRLLADGAIPAELVLYAKDRRFTAGFAAVNAARSQATPSLDQYDVPATGQGARLEMRPLAWLRIGADARWASGETRERFRFLSGAFTRNRVAGGDQRQLAGFAEASLRPQEALLLSAGLRLEHWSLSDGARVETDLANGAETLRRNTADRSDTQVSWRAGAKWDVTPGLSLRAAAYTGLRIPTLNELYRPFRVGNDVTEANAALRPERLRGAELGLTWQPLPQSRIDITLFDNRLRDAIGNVTLGQGPGIFPDLGFLPAGGTFRQRLNLPELGSRGVEVALETPLPAGFDGRLSYAYAATRVRDAGTFTALQDKRLAQSPRHTGSARVTWSSPDQRWQLTTLLEHMSGAFEDDLNSRRLPAATLLSASATFALTEQLSIQVGADNILSEELVSAVSADGLITRVRVPKLFAAVEARW